MRIIKKIVIWFIVYRPCTYFIEIAALCASKPWMVLSHLMDLQPTPWAVHIVSFIDFWERIIYHANWEWRRLTWDLSYGFVISFVFSRILETLCAFGIAALKCRNFFYLFIPAKMYQFYGRFHNASFIFVGYKSKRRKSKKISCEKSRIIPTVASTKTMTTSLFNWVESSEVDELAMACFTFKKFPLSLTAGMISFAVNSLNKILQSLKLCLATVCTVIIDFVSIYLSLYSSYSSRLVLAPANRTPTLTFYNCLWKLFWPFPAT